MARDGSPRAAEEAAWLRRMLEKEQQARATAEQALAAERLRNALLEREAAQDMGDSLCMYLSNSRDPATASLDAEGGGTQLPFPAASPGNWSVYSTKGLGLDRPLAAADDSARTPPAGRDQRSRLGGGGAGAHAAEFATPQRPLPCDEAAEDATSVGGRGGQGRLHQQIVEMSTRLKGFASEWVQRLEAMEERPREGIASDARQAPPEVPQDAAQQPATTGQRPQQRPLETPVVPAQTRRDGVVAEEPLACAEGSPLEAWCAQQQQRRPQLNAQRQQRAQPTPSASDESGADGRVEVGLALVTCDDAACFQDACPSFGDDSRGGPAHDPWHHQIPGGGAELDRYTGSSGDHDHGFVDAQPPSPAHSAASGPLSAARGALSCRLAARAGRAQPHPHAAAAAAATGVTAPAAPPSQAAPHGWAGADGNVSKSFSHASNGSGAAQEEAGLRSSITSPLMDPDVDLAPPRKSGMSRAGTRPLGDVSRAGGAPAAQQRAAAAAAAAPPDFESSDDDDYYEDPTKSTVTMTVGAAGRAAGKGAAAAQVAAPALQQVAGDRRTTAEAAAEHFAAAERATAARAARRTDSGAKDRQHALNEALKLLHSEFAEPAAPMAAAAGTEGGSAEQQQQQQEQKQQQAAGAAASPPQASRRSSSAAAGDTHTLPEAAPAAATATLPPPTAPAWSVSVTPHNTAARPQPRAVFLYASQTGNGREIARTLQTEAGRRGVPADVMALDELGFPSFGASKTPVAVIVTSSTGDGEPPDNGAAFFKQLLAPAQAKGWRLEGVKFALLGLGDSSYSRFMAAPRAMRARLVELGAEEFYAAGEADDSEGMDKTVEPWCENLWAPLKTALLDASGGPGGGGAAVAAHALAGTLAAEGGPALAAAHAPLAAAPRLAAEASKGSAAQAAAAVAAVPKVYLEISMMSLGDSADLGELEPPSRAEGGGSGSRPGSGPQQQQHLSHLAPTVAGVQLRGSEREAAEEGAPQGQPLEEERQQAQEARSDAKPQQELSAEDTEEQQQEEEQQQQQQQQQEEEQQQRDEEQEEERSQQEGDDQAPQEEGPQQAQPQAGQPVQAAPREPGGLVGGLAPEGADLKGAPGLAPPRVEVSFDVAPAVSEDVRARELSWPSEEQRKFRKPTGAYSAAAPFYARVAEARLLTAPGSDRVVVHCELDIAGSGITHKAGDALAVLPQNDPEMVAALLQRLGLDGERVFEIKAAGRPAPGATLLPHIVSPCSLRHALTHNVDIAGKPQKGLLRLLAEHCRNEAEKRTLLFLCAKAGAADYTREIVAGHPCLLDLLNRFASCAPPLAALLDALPPLAPRAYAISAAPAAGAGASAARLQFAFRAVSFQAPSGRCAGVATGWLQRLLAPRLAGEGTADADAWMPILLRPSQTFAPPPQLATPLIMIGSGTGTTPFRAFLQERAAARAAAAAGTAAAAAAPAVGEAWLYAGCRRRDEDFLYGADFDAFEASGDLTRLRVACSREGDKRAYVQHLVRQDGAALADLIVRRGARVCVCGEGLGMAREVHAALAAVLHAHVGMSEGEANEELRAMAEAGAYVREASSP
ncbi:5-methyltetrahydrofolate-homocysteine methyltransferase reductase [Monoraphidium neglectum]|uniref:Methionine synthase reductase n=1 Tax=Monoraphidium neglectum TaxID=145388 RepID=A0A0D2N4U9_9CHLO|nr:5-methyltetrahydrofolate-homocysteine methyltransferase reductase [Monoraphidium neglectum]KIZ07342.1 5-methyltetrahydrofolate-homocysteine methyltransferase reductase [Monoraphidium neglectum]|eukprot:XP_013906361.1 5-methyltetrahydrofolate-homocysteine methyltransferase reductase [Monoraphidium neglectum]